MLQALFLLFRRFARWLRSFRPLPATDAGCGAKPLRLPRQYQRVRTLAIGGMGHVFAADHPKFGRVAIKLGARDTPSVRALLRREAQVTMALSHPNVVRVHEIGETRDGIPYYTMPLVEGTTLRRLVECWGRQAPASVAGVLAQICDALAATLARGLVHGDLKPTNIMISSERGVAPRVTVLDFGLSTAVGTVQRPSFDPGGLLGTPAYLAPEVLRGSGLSERSELYAVGLVGYWLLTGQHAFAATGVRELEHCHAHVEPVSPSALVGEPLPYALEDAIMRCLRKRPEARPRSVAWLAAELWSIEKMLQAEPTEPCSRVPILPPAVLDPEAASIESTVPDLSVRFDTAAVTVRA